MNFVFSLFILSYLILVQVTSVSIKPKSCYNHKRQHGTCMFVWECIRTEGRHLGTCTDTFLIGSCCKHNERNNMLSTSQPSSSAVNTTWTQKPTDYNSNKVHHTTPQNYHSTTLSSQHVMSVSGAHFKPTTSSVPTSSVPKKPYSECGVPFISQRYKVVGGTDAGFGYWPWQISIRKLRGSYGFESSHRCGGVILNELWIATAAHCVEDLRPTHMRVRVGEYDFANTNEPFRDSEKSVQRKILHPGYNVFTYEHDLGLLKLREALVFRPHISRICLPSSDSDLMGMTAVITGWGRLREGGILPSVLQKVQVPIISNEKCREMFKKAGKIELVPETFLCAGFPEGGRDSCQGDSGGPLQVQGADGKWFLAGIISWGIGCAQPNMPGVCVRISKYKDWITRTIE